MIKIRAINKYDPKQIVNDIVDGKKVYRINFNVDSIVNMENRAVKNILIDEKNSPQQYAYFEVIPDEPNELEEIDDIITELEKEFILDPPSARLRIAAGVYEIETKGMTTRQIITSILVKEAIEKQETKC